MTSQPTCKVAFLFDGHGDLPTIQRVQEALDRAAPHYMPQAEAFWHSLRVTLDVPQADQGNLPSGTWWTSLTVATEPIDAAFDVLKDTLEDAGLTPSMVTNISAEMATGEARKLAPVIELRRSA